MNLGAQVLSWIMHDPVRSLIFFILVVCTAIITTFKRRVRVEVDKLVTSNEALKTHMDSHEDAIGKEMKACKVLVKDIQETVTDMKSNLESTLKEISSHKSDIVKALLENKQELKQSTELYKKAIIKFVEVKKEVDSNMGRILLVDEKLKTLVQRGKK